MPAGNPPNLVSPELDPVEQALLEARGADLLRHVLDRRWIFRRIETVTFNDDVSRIRDVHVDFRLPAGLPIVEQDGGKRACLVPLTLVGKPSPTNFDFADEAGDQLPLLPARERAAIASGLLLAIARSVVGTPLSTDLRADLRDIAGMDEEESLAARACLLERPHRGSRPHQRLKDSAFFRLSSLAMAGNFIAVLPVPCAGPANRRVTFSYTERRQRVFRRSRTSTLLRFRDVVARSLAWRPKETRLMTPAVGQGGTYHLRLQAPDGLKVTGGTLFPYGLDPRTGDLAPLPTVPASGSRDSPHVYVRELPLGSAGFAQFDLRPRGRTVIRAAAFTTFATALLLGLGSHAVPTLAGPTNETNVDAAATLLLIVPTVAAAYVARPAEHPMTTSLVFGVRLLALLAGVASFGAACVLVLRARGHTAQDAWNAFAALSILISISMARTVLATLFEGVPPLTWIGWKIRPP